MQYCNNQSLSAYWKEDIEILYYYSLFKNYKTYIYRILFIIKMYSYLYIVRILIYYTYN